jgi:hypothetical protein
VPAECDDDAISSALAGFGTVVSVSHREGRDFAARWQEATRKLYTSFITQNTVQ